MSANPTIFPKIQTPDPKSVGGVAPSADQAIDMGLSVKWAPWNVGASRAEEYGAYFAWGEINASKEVYDWDTYFYFVDRINRKLVLGKYDDYAENEILESSDDAASANWGCGWRMPTKAELDELLDENNCKWTWVKNYNDSGINGYEIKSKKTEGVLFLPVAGHRWKSDLYSASYCGCYWSSELYLGTTHFAHCLNFDFFDPYYNDDHESRDRGYSVRAVAVSAE